MSMRSATSRRAPTWPYARRRTAPSQPRPSTAPCYRRVGGSNFPPMAKPKVNFDNVRAEARALIWEHRRTLAIGLALMLINRIAGLVLPGATKYFIDDVIGNRRADLLLPLALISSGAILVQA